jgi:hypothetical protein
LLDKIQESGELDGEGEKTLATAIEEFKANSVY